MNIEFWFITGMLLVILVIVTTQFSRLVVFLLELHRSERSEYTKSTNRVISSLEVAIREASQAGTTNIFQGDHAHAQTLNDDAHANQVADNKGVVGE